MEKIITKPETVERKSRELEQLIKQIKTLFDIDDIKIEDIEVHLSFYKKKSKIVIAFQPESKVFFKFRELTFEKGKIQGKQ